MKDLMRLLRISLLGLMLIGSTAQADSKQQSPEGLQVLKSMSEFISRQDGYRLTGQASSDAWLEAGLVISNTAEIELSYREPASMNFTRLGGGGMDVLNIDKGQLLYFDSSTGYYATADTPEGINQALDYAFEKLGIDLPLMDLVRADAFERMVGDGDIVMYLTDGSRVGGVNCHQLVIRAPDLDIQLWVQEGDQPLPRRVVLTDKWLQGSPRFVANMQWELNPEFERDSFEYSPPEGAERIEFIQVADE
jgi:hypothetical protein